MERSRTLENMEIWNGTVPNNEKMGINNGRVPNNKKKWDTGMERSRTPEKCRNGEWNGPEQ